jgi:acyl dehydratase
MEADGAESEEFRQRLDALIGRPVGSSGSSVGPDPVNQPMIRHWAAAFEDANPVYTDPEFAATTRFGGVVAPPLMLQTWTMATPTITGIAERGGSPVESEGASPLAVFDEAGFVATLASNTEFDIDRYLRPGETVSASTVIESISPRKNTRIGPGYFVTWLTTYVAGAGDVVGRQRFRILKFRPEAPA